MRVSYRLLSEMKEVIFDREWLAKQKRNFRLYEMRREIARTGNVRYDVTKLYGKMLGREFNKTLGHYHPDGFPEIYEVLKGKAICLLQKPARINSRRIVHAVAVYAKKGEQVVIPPRYGHVTINPTSKTLLMGNLVSCRFSSIYEPYKRFGGACYYYTRKGWVKNKNYVVGELERVRAKRFFKLTLKELLLKHPNEITWLEKPKTFPKKFEIFLREQALSQRR